MTDQFLLKIHYERRKLFSALLFMFFVFGNALYAQNQNVSGVVSDNIGPMPGVTVIVAGSNTGTTTDFDGRYSLDNVPSNAVLEFSYIGFAVQNVSVNGRSEINVTLEQDTQQL